MTMTDELAAIRTASLEAQQTGKELSEALSRAYSLTAHLHEQQSAYLRLYEASGDTPESADALMKLRAVQREVTRQVNAANSLLDMLRAGLNQITNGG